MNLSITIRLVSSLSCVLDIWFSILPLLLCPSCLQAARAIGASHHLVISIVNTDRDSLLSGTIIRTLLVQILEGLA